MGPAERGALEEATAEISSIATQFARAARPIIERALHRRLEALLHAERVRLDARNADVEIALREAAERAIALGGADAERRLLDVDLWLEPMTAPGVVPRTELCWDGVLPEWLSGFLRRFSRRHDAPALAGLDDPGHRIWVAVVSAAKPLDPVLQEFGLPASSSPDLGGGHYGLRPRTAAELDPTGSLERLWRRYRPAYERYAALVRGD